MTNRLPAGGKKKGGFCGSRLVKSAPSRWPKKKGVLWEPIGQIGSQQVAKKKRGFVGADWSNRLPAGGQEKGGFVGADCDQSAPSRWQKKGGFCGSRLVKSAPGNRWERRDKSIPYLLLLLLLLQVGVKAIVNLCETRGNPVGNSEGPL